MTIDRPLEPGATIGLVGGGQLGRMLAMAAARFGYRVVILEPAADCPAAQVANRHLVAGYDDRAALTELAQICDVVTYEFENVPDSTAELLAERVALYPPPNALTVAQDRLTEKEFLTATGLATAPFATISSPEDVRAALATVGLPAIVKTRRLGYDGKGQVRIEALSPDEVDGQELFERLGRVPLIAEGFIDFTCEISVVAARSMTETGAEVRAFEPARNDHDGGILRRSTVPAGVSPATITAAIEAAARVLEALDYVGVLGLELFVTADGAIVANELAPRVHNSAHWTELACVTDQFEQHIRAISGHRLGDPTARPCEMVNLIGDEVEQAPDLAAEGWRVHLYGKADARPGRKMGHATRLS